MRPLHFRAPLRLSQALKNRKEVHVPRPSKWITKKRKDIRVVCCVRAGAERREDGLCVAPACQVNPQANQEKPRSCVSPIDVGASGWLLEVIGSRHTYWPLVVAPSVPFALAAQRLSQKKCPWMMLCGQTAASPEKYIRIAL
jgi:hypothetical protein